MFVWFAKHCLAEHCLSFRVTQTSVKNSWFFRVSHLFRVFWLSFAPGFTCRRWYKYGYLINVGTHLDPVVLGGGLGQPAVGLAVRVHVVQTSVVWLVVGWVEAVGCKLRICDGCHIPHTHLVVAFWRNKMKYSHTLIEQTFKVYSHSDRTD